MKESELHCDTVETFKAMLRAVSLRDNRIGYMLACYGFENLMKHRQKQTRVSPSFTDCLTDTDSSSSEAELPAHKKPFTFHNMRFNAGSAYQKVVYFANVKPDMITP
jgi:hypothetical protein